MHPTHSQLRRLPQSTSRLPRSAHVVLMVVVLVATGGPLHAQVSPDACDSGEFPVTGIVADMLSRQPLPGAVVTVQAPASFVRQVVGRAVANAFGRFVVCVDSVMPDWDAFAQLDTLSSRALPVSTAGVVDTLYLVGSEPANVSGIVRLQGTRVPLEGARVTIENRRVRVTTDSQGRFIFRGIGAGLVVIATSHIGYATRRDSLFAGSGAAVQLDITLGLEAVELDELLVTARTAPSTRSRAPREMGMSATQVEEALPGSIDFVAMLRRANLPGLLVTGTGGFAGICVEFLHTSGGCAMVAVYVNGSRISEASTWLASVDPSIVREFFVLRPAFAQFQYMGAPNGVLDITLR